MPEHRDFPTIVSEDPAPYSNVVLDDNYAFLAGLVAADLPEGQDAMGDTAAETEAVMIAIGRLLNEVGLGYADIVRVDVHLADLADMPAMNATYGGFFESMGLPARTTVQAAALVEGSRVEITVMARRR